MDCNLWRPYVILAAMVLAFASGASAAGDWTKEIARFIAYRDGAALAADATVKSGDRLVVELTPPDEPESLGVTFFTANPDRKQRGAPARLAFDFDGMPIKFTKAADANRWTVDFTVPKTEKARSVGKGGFTVTVLRYGADTHYDGESTFAAPFAFDFAEGANEGAKTLLVIYDFGPDDTPVCRGAKQVSQRNCPKELKWIHRPNRWEKSVMNRLDALMNDWADRDGGVPIAFALELPEGSYRVAAGFGGYCQMCWANGPFQLASYAFSVNGREIFRRVMDEKARFAFREHEAQPGEDVYETYLLPILPETRGDFSADGKPVVFSLENLDKTVDNGPEYISKWKNRRIAIDYLAVWKAGDREAEERFNALLERRRLHFNGVLHEKPAADHYGLGGGYAEEAKRVLADSPKLKAVENPYDWVLPQLEPVGQCDAVRIRAAKGEKTGGAFFFRSENDVKRALAVTKGLPAWTGTKTYRLMNYRFINGYGGLHQIAPNQLLEGPRAMKAGVNYSWYVRLEVPKDAPAGVYAGEVEVVADGVRRTLPVELTVYDAVLPELDDYRIGLMGYGDGSEKQMRFAKNELGATTVHISNGRIGGAMMVYDDRGRAVGCTNIGWCSVAELDRRFKTYNKVGFPCRVPYCGPSSQGGAADIEQLKAWTPEWTNAVRIVHETILAVARSNGLDSVALDIGGEIGHDAHEPNPTVLANTIRYVKLVKELVPDIETSFRCNCLASTTNLYPLLDYPTIRGRSWGWVDRESGFGTNGKRIGVYSQGGRFMNGVSMWYHGATGSFREWVAWGHDLEFNEVLCQGACGCAGHFEGQPGPADEGGFTLNQRSEAWRAGINDVRYLKLFDDALKAAPEGEARAKAVAFRQFLHDAVRNSWVFCRFCALGGPGRQDGGNDWPYLRIDLVREAAIRCVAALKNGRPADLPDFPVLPKVDQKYWFQLDDGPLQPAHDREIRGQLRITDGERRAKWALTLSGNGIEPREIEIRKQSLKGRQLYYIPGTAAKEFALDASDLGPGVYGLTLSKDGAPCASIPVILVQEGKYGESCVLERF